MDKSKGERKVVSTEHLPKAYLENYLASENDNIKLSYIILLLFFRIILHPNQKKRSFLLVGDEWGGPPLFIFLLWTPSDSVSGPHKTSCGLF